MPVIDVRKLGRSSLPHKRSLRNKALRFELTQIATELPQEGEPILSGAGMEVLCRRQIAFDHLAGRPPTLKSLLVEKTVEMTQQLDLRGRVDATRASKAQKVGKTIRESTDKSQEFSSSTSGQSRDTCLSVSRSMLV